MQKSALFAAAGVAAALMIGSDAMAQQPDTLRPVPPAPAMPSPDAQPTTAPTVVDALRGSVNFSVLLSLIDAAGLEETLTGEGPYTIFATTDEAFQRIPAPVRESLMRDSARLRQLLLNHAVSGSLSAADVQQASTATTLSGGTVAIPATDGEVRIDNAVVTRVDVMAENGVVHAVSSVLLSGSDATPTTQQSMPTTMPTTPSDTTTIPPVR